jgi:hypothetical protein
VKGRNEREIKIKDKEKEIEERRLCNMSMLITGVI